MTTPKRSLNPLTWIFGLSILFFIFFLASSSFIFSSRTGGGSGGLHRSGKLFKKGSVGVLELNGVIMDSRRMLKQLKDFEEDDTVKAVVLRLNSPGGAVAPSQEIYEEVKKFPKPLVVSMASIAASGAYYVAMGSKYVFANPGTITGSIGVIMEFANLEKLYEWAKVKRYVIKTGKFKDSGSEFREMQPEERALLQGMVDDVLKQFKKAVEDGRKLSAEQVDRIADGRIFSGSQAHAQKLVDELGGIQEALKKAGNLAKLGDHPEVVYPDHARHSLLDQLMGGGDESDSDSEASVEPINARAGGSQALLNQLKQLLGVGQLAGVTAPPGLYWIWPGAR